MGKRKATKKPSATATPNPELEAEIAAHQGTKNELAEAKKTITKLQKPFVEFEETEAGFNIVFHGGADGLHPGLHAWMTGSKVTNEIRHDRVSQAIKLGLLAQWQGRVGHAINTYKDHMKEEFALLSAYQNTLEEKFMRDSLFKTDQEITVKDALFRYISRQGYGDAVEITATRSEEGTTNKTGDIRAVIPHAGTHHELAIEVKFATDFKRGGIDSKSNVKTSYRSQDDTTISQLIEARSNRNARFAIIVLDHSLNLKSTTPDIEFSHEGQGIIVKIDLLAGNFSALESAYELARTLTLASTPINMDYSVLEFLLKDLNDVLDRGKRMTGVVEQISKQVIKSHNATMKTIGEQKALHDADLAATKISIEQTTKALKNFFKTGAFEASTGFEMYIKKKANQAWDLEKTKAEEWTKDLNQRLQDGLKAQESVNDDEAETESVEKAVEPKDVDTDPETISNQQEDLDKLSVAELKERCKSLRLPVSGKKAELIQRIKTSLQDD
jgi:uncharacterized small protein (DUF1192 family)